jgi:hypothetical protein
LATRGQELFQWKKCPDLKRRSGIDLNQKHKRRWQMIARATCREDDVFAVMHGWMVGWLGESEGKQKVAEFACAKKKAGIISGSTA